MSVSPCLWRRLVALFLIAFLAAVAEVNSASAADPQRLQQLAAQLEKLEAGLPEAQRTGPGPLADAKLALQKLAILQSSRFAPQPPDADFAKAETAIAALAEKPPAHAAPRTGFQERAYVSDVDGSVQPYVLYVPAGYSAAREWPMLVFLHGYYPGLDATNWIDLMYPTVLQEVCEAEGVILLEPFGRSNTEFMGIGEQDVLRTMEFVRAEYRMDPRRIILSGVSMGGSGAYSIACHFPDRFAGLAGLTGRVDYYEWMRVPKNSLPRFKQVQVDTDYARELLPNLLHVPVVLLHGADDPTLSVTQSRLMDRLLTELKQPCQYFELKGKGHYDLWRADAMKHPALLDMIRNARAPAKPSHVQFRTFTLKYPSAYWVKIEAIQRWGEVCDVDAAAAPDGTITVKASNAGALVLGPQFPEGVDAKRIKVIVNGQPVEARPLPDGALAVSLSPQGDIRTLQKTSAICGPIREAWRGPFMIVYPAEDLPQNAADRANAARLWREWAEYAQGAAMLKKDTQVTDADIRERNLIVCGTPATNRVLARMAEKLPVRIEADKYVVGKREFPLAGNGFQMIYPNPLNRARYVLVVQGAQWGAELQANHKLDLLPDFIIYTAQTEPDGTLFPTNRYLCAGYFDGNWQLCDSATWVNAAVAPQGPK